MKQVLSAIYYPPNAFLFYGTTAENNDKLLDNNLESENIIQEQKIAEKKPQLTTKYVKKILIKNTEKIMHLLYNVSIGFGYDLNKAIDKIKKD